MNQPPQINKLWEDRRNKVVSKDTGGRTDRSHSEEG